MKRLLFLLIIGVSGAAVLVSLGLWQVKRLEWKTALLSEITTRIADDPVPLPAQPTPDADRYLPVEVTGRFLPGEVPVLTSRGTAGAGYRIVAPFQTDGGRRILVDRGFVPQPDHDAMRSLGTATVAGNLDWPRETDSFTPEPDLEDNIWFARDVPAMARALDTEPLLLVARNQTDSAVTPWPVGITGIPNDHLGYAITWFGLAAVWVAMTIFFLWRPRARNDD